MSEIPSVWPEETEVLALDLDVREAMPSTAEETVFRAAAQHGSGHQVFLKIDSTLRGPIAAMVRGALRGTGKSLAVVAPAFPEQGRLVRDGQLYTNGTPGPRVDDLLDHQPEAVVVDDVRQVAEDARNNSEWLLVGSAGLARQLAAPVCAPIPSAMGTGPLLVVAGTPAIATREQLNLLNALQGVVILRTPPSEARDLGEAARGLAEEVARWAERHTPRAVVLTGGATARAVCDRLNVRALCVRGEIAPGIPISTFEGSRWHGTTVVTKAGGFGGPEALLDVVRALS